MPLQISILNPLTSWTRNDPLAALEVEYSVTVFTLTSSVQIKRIHRLLVSTDLTDKPSAAADETGGDMASTQPHSGHQGGDQLPGVELL